MSVYCQNIACAFILIIAVIKLIAQELVGTARTKSVLSMKFGQCVVLNIVIPVAELVNMTINKGYVSRRYVSVDVIGPENWVPRANNRH